MMDAKGAEWLLENADAPIRYRVARELLGDAQAAKKIERELFGHPTVKRWLGNLKPETPPQHRCMVHGSFDFCLENAVNKAVQLGLHAGLPPVADALKYYVEIMRNVPVKAPYRQSDRQLGPILIANMLTLADVHEESVLARMLGSLNELYAFVRQGGYDIYLSGEERKGLKGVPSIWKEKRFIKKHLFDNGPAYPLIYDVIALHKLYKLKRADVDEKVNAVIEYISTDAFHQTIQDGYGIVICGGEKYYGMGWDPKYPGWFDVTDFMKNANAQKLLYFAEYIANYPLAVKTRWFTELLDYLDTFQTKDGTYAFPSAWFQETKGYAVQGHHLPFGEDRRKKNWAETESTFYMQLLHKSI